MTNRYSIVIVAVCVLLALGSWIVLENSRIVTASHLASLSTPLPNTIHMPLLAKNYQPPPDPFLRAPYYGTWNLSCVFDHDLPIHVGQSSTPGVTHFNGFTSTVCYDGHNGYDYYSVSRYDSVLAAGEGIVSEVRWNYPDNHRKGLGIFVRIAHDSDYTTLYGHLSTALVSEGTVITNSTDGQILGISGNTGSVSSSSGCDPNTDPMCAGHLHFEVRRNNFVVDPYGWITTTVDPWVARQTENDTLYARSYDIWEEYPALSTPTRGRCTYPTSDARTPPSPPLEAWATIVDNNDTNYNETPGCWNMANPNAAYGNNLRYTARVTSQITCEAQWSLLPEDNSAGDYQVYAHIVPYSQALSEGFTSSQGAHYWIHHARQDNEVIVNQWAFTNTGHTSPWVYLGQYHFNREGNEFVRIVNQTDDYDQIRYILADAIRFIPLTSPPPTVTPTPSPTQLPPLPTHTPIPSPTPTATPSYSDNYEPNDDFTTAYHIGADFWYASYIWTSTDEDYFKFYVTAEPSTYVIVELQNIPMGTDYNLQLYSPTRELLSSSNHSSNTDEFIRYWTDESGYYYVRVYPSYGSHQMETYQLRVAQENAPATSTSKWIIFDSTGVARQLSPEEQNQAYNTSTDLIFDFSDFITSGCELHRVFPSIEREYLAADINCEWGGMTLVANTSTGEIRIVEGNWGKQSLFLDWLPGPYPKLVIRADPTNSTGVYLIAPESLTTEQLVVPNTTYAVSFSPDGKYALFATTLGLGYGSELWMLDYDRNQIRRLLQKPKHLIIHPRWSPNGKMWTYIQMEDSEVPFTVGELWGMNAKGTKKFLAQADAGHGYEPVWAPDSTAIAFIVRENVDDAVANTDPAGLQSNLYIASALSGQIQAVTQFRLYADLWDGLIPPLIPPRARGEEPTSPRGRGNRGG